MAEAPVLRVRGLELTYEGAVRALRGVDLEVAQGEAVAIVGPNGAGKTSLLRAISGLHHLHRGRITAGQVEMRGTVVAGAGRRWGAGPAGLVRLGASQVMEGRRVFGSLTVEENLLAGAFCRRDRAGVNTDLERMLERFPALGRRRSTRAGHLSGGEQQLLAIARALMGAPRLLLADEPSLGLAPDMVDEVARLLAALNQAGTAILVTDQRHSALTGFAQRAQGVDRGRLAPRPALLAAPRSGNT